VKDNSIHVGRKGQGILPLNDSMRFLSSNVEDWTLHVVKIGRSFCKTREAMKKGKAFVCKMFIGIMGEHSKNQNVHLLCSGPITRYNSTSIHMHVKVPYRGPFQILDQP
jgi:hypothetical protein